VLGEYRGEGFKEGNKGGDKLNGKGFSEGGEKVKNKFAVAGRAEERFAGTKQRIMNLRRRRE